MGDMTRADNPADKLSNETLVVKEENMSPANKNPGGIVPVGKPTRPVGRPARWTEEEDNQMKEYVQAKRDKGEISQEFRCQSFDFWEKANKEGFLPLRSIQAMRKHWADITPRARSESDIETIDVEEDDEANESESESEADVVGLGKRDSMSLAIIALCMVLHVIKLYEDELKWLVQVVSNKE